MSGYNNYDDDEDGRYKTPDSFRRTKDSEQEKRKLAELREKENLQNSLRLDLPNEGRDHTNKDMSNPYIDKGYTMPYQVSQNKYREQVFGTKLGSYNYPQERPEPLAGRERYPDRNPVNLYVTPRQQQQDQPTYRSGRPDLGFDDGRTNYVPYPQEPIRRRRPEYDMPPDIGYRAKFDPYAEPETSKKARDVSAEDGGGKADISLEDGMGPHPGWILLMRFHRDGETQVRRALTMCSKHIESDSGRILGLARAYSVRIREGGDAWVTFGKLRHFGGGNWDIQQSPTQDETNYCVLAIYYPSLSRAIQWFDRDSCFKQKDFPAPYTTDAIALPLNSSVDTKYSKTLVMTEYPRISHPEYFRDKFSIPTEDMMRTRFRASPYVVKASSIPTDDPRQRVARHLRGCWIKRNSIITLSMFDSIQETHRYFTDPEYYKCKEAQDRVSAPTTVIMDLEDWKL